MYGMGFFINSYIFGSYSYIVDDYSPIIAFSVRKLSSSATNCLRVRRDSDNAEQDIGFNGNDLDTSALISFVGAGNGYVVKVYNQGTGGSTYDATQSTTAQQHGIVNSGSLQNLGGIAAMVTGTRVGMNVGGLGLSVTNLVYCHRYNFINPTPYVLGGTDKGFFFGGTFSGINGIGGYDGTNIRTDSVGEDTLHHIGSFSIRSGSLYVSLDNSSENNIGTFGSMNINAIAGYSSVSARDEWQEAIIFTSLVSPTVISEIKENMNNYYSVYEYLVDVYSPIGAWATSKISSTATNCLRVRRSSDNAEQDIGFDGNSLDTTSLLSFVGANDGYVTKFYNQGTGGATYDVIQATTANQPFIVSGGTITTDSNTGAVSLFSNNTSRYLATSGTILIDDSSMVSVHKPSSSGAMGSICAGEGATGKRRSLVQFTSGTLQMFASGYSANLSLGSVSASNTYLSHATFDNVSNVVYGSLNGSTTSGSITLNTPVAKKISLMSTSEDGDAFVEGLQGNFTMAMIWNTQNESNMANVVADINNIYSIY